MKVAFGAEQVKPGEAVDIEVQTEGPARVGLVAVDKSVFILAENRLNLRQVFDELERLYLEPRVELHEAWALNSITTRGASETFEDAGLVVMTNMDVPDGEEHIERRPQPAGAVQAVAAEAAPRDLQADSGVTVPQGLAEVQRVRQFFPETWLWTDLTTDEQGHAVLPVEDSITSGAQSAFGVDEAQGQDLPFSARGEDCSDKGQDAEERSQVCNRKRDTKSFVRRVRSVTRRKYTSEEKITQTIEGLEGLLRMPFGCGEQNMVLCRRSAIMGLM